MRLNTCSASRRKAIHFMANIPGWINVRGRCSIALFKLLIMSAAWLSLLTGCSSGVKPGAPLQITQTTKFVVLSPENKVLALPESLLEDMRHPEAAVITRNGLELQRVDDIVVTNVSASISETRLTWSDGQTHFAASGYKVTVAYTVMADQNASSGKRTVVVHSARLAEFLKATSASCLRVTEIPLLGRDPKRDPPDRTGMLAMKVINVRGR